MADDRIHQIFSNIKAKIVNITDNTIIIKYTIDITKPLTAPVRWTLKFMWGNKILTILLLFTIYSISLHWRRAHRTDRAEEILTELLLRATAAESILRNPEISYMDRISHANLFLNEPKKKLTYDMGKFIKPNSKFTHMSAVDLISTVKEDHDWGLLYKHRNAITEQSIDELGMIDFSLRHISDNYGPEIISQDNANISCPNLHMRILQAIDPLTAKNSPYYSKMIGKWNINNEIVKTVFQGQEVNPPEDLSPGSALLNIIAEKNRGGLDIRNECYWWRPVGDKAETMIYLCTIPLQSRIESTELNDPEGPELWTEIRIINLLWQIYNAQSQDGRMFDYLPYDFPGVQEDINLRPDMGRTDWSINEKAILKSAIKLIQSYFLFEDPNAVLGIPENSPLYLEHYEWM